MGRYPSELCGLTRPLRTPAGGSYAFAWEIPSGGVKDDTIDFTAKYTQGAPGTTMHVVGKMAKDGSMSGTWTDNYNGRSKTGAWTARKEK